VLHHAKLAAVHALTTDYPAHQPVNFRTDNMQEDDKLEIVPDMDESDSDDE